MFHSQVYSQSSVATPNTPLSQQGGSQSTSGEGGLPVTGVKRPRSAAESLQELSGCISLTEAETTILREGCQSTAHHRDSTDPALKKFTSVVITRVVERTVVLADGSTRTQPVNFRAGNFFLVPTKLYNNMWDFDETSGDLVFAYCEIISAHEGDGAQRMSFVVRGHSSDVDPKDKTVNFPLTGRTLAVEFIPHYAILPESSAHEGLKARYPPNVRTSGAQGKHGRSRAGRGRADLAEGLPSEESRSIVGRDLELVEFRAKNEDKFLDYITPFQRVMAMEKRAILIRESSEYSRTWFDSALEPYLNFRVEAQEGMHEEVVALTSYFRMAKMPFIRDGEKRDRAYQCLFKAKDWSFHSVADYREVEGVNDAVMEGTGRESRLSLLECVKGYLLFLSILFHCQAKNFLERFRRFLENYHPKRDGPTWDTLFLRARMESLLVDFWQEVRTGLTRSARFPARSFSTPGDVWRLLYDFESEMLDSFSNNVEPHTNFRSKGGELDTTIRETGRSGRQDRNTSGGGGQRPPEQREAPRQICAWHLGQALKLEKKDGSLMDPCSRGSGCLHAHSELRDMTAAQAKAAAVSTMKGPMLERFEAAIAVEESAFSFRKT